MKNKFVKTQAINNFMGSLDLSLPITDHIWSALRDSVAYQWNQQTINELIYQIKKAYGRSK